MSRFAFHLMILAASLASHWPPPVAAAELTSSESSEPAHVERNAAGETLVSLNQETLRRLQLETAPTTARTVHPELRAFGRVLDPSPIVELVSQLQTAEVTAATSGAEYQRLTRLREQDNASDRALEQARAAMIHDQQQFQSLERRLRLQWGSKLDRQVLEAWLPDLLNGSRVLVRVDMEADGSLAKAPAQARLELAGKGRLPDPASLIDRLPATDPGLQGPAWLFVAANRDGALAPGRAVTAFLPESDQQLQGVVVPRDAVLRADGRTWVFLKTQDGEFTRREVTLNQPLDEGWLVTKGLTAGDEVVTAGTATLLSTEIQFRGGGGGEED